jgi:ketosteroid isomerase-like protein
MHKFILPICALAILSACATLRNPVATYAQNYHPDDQKLYDTIQHLDSLFFATYNTCAQDIEKHASFYADSIEFYHDQGGLMTSKKDVVDATKRNICGKVRRELIIGSIEVYPIHGFGAIETGLHCFHNSAEPVGTPAKIGKFTIIWRHKDGQWKIYRVISLH